MAASLSPSRANDFVQCPLLYRFRTVDRLPEPQSPAAARGTLVHAVLERLFDLPAAQRTPEAAAAMVRPEWDRLVAEDPERARLAAEAGDEQWISAARDLVDRWFALENPQRLEPAGREQLVKATGEVVELKGFIDRLDVAPTGEVRIVDYKTGKAPRPQYADKVLFQMMFYALIHRKLTGVLVTQLQVVYLGSGEILRHAPSHAELDEVEARILSIWQAIQEATSSMRWDPRPSRLCDWCHFRPICPAFGGTPPPLPVPQDLEQDRPQDAEVEQARESEQVQAEAQGPAAT